MNKEISEIITKNFITSGFGKAFDVIQTEAQNDQIAYTTEDTLEIIISLSSFTKKAIEEIEIKEAAKPTIDKLNNLLDHLATLASKMIKKDFPKKLTKKFVDAIDYAITDPGSDPEADVIEYLIDAVEEVENYGINPIFNTENK